MDLGKMRGDIRELDSADLRKLADIVQDAIVADAQKSKVWFLTPEEEEQVRTSHHLLAIGALSRRTGFDLQKSRMCVECYMQGAKILKK